jgi:hypothetical protein
MSDAAFNAVFDELEASFSDVFADTFAVKEEGGNFAQAAFTRSPNVNFETDYTLTQPPTVQAVDFDGDDLKRAEQATIQVPRSQVPYDTLPEDCMVDLPDLGRWNLDKIRGTVFGANWVTVYLSRKPLLHLTSRRQG